MTKNNISVMVNTTKDAMFTFTGEHGASALAAVRAHQEIHAMGKNPRAEGLSDLVIPYSAVAFVGWTLLHSDETVEDANCKVQTPEPESASLSIQNGTQEPVLFTLTLGDTSINGKYGDFTFTNGVAQASVAVGGRLTLTGVADGTSYTISGSVEAQSGSLTGTTPATVVVTSTSE